MTKEHKPTLEEKKFFIQGPDGRIEALVSGIDLIDSINTLSTFSPLIKETETKTPKIIGVVCHPHPLYQGSMHNKVVTTICKAWQGLDLATVRFNFRGVGESEGHYGDGLGERLDLEAVLHFLQTNFPQSQFWLAGFSFGSYIALQVAAEPKSFPIQTLLTVAPPVHHFEFKTITLPNCPWVIIQGDQDSIVPYEKVFHWASNLQEQKSDLEFISMIGAEHFFHGQLIELKTIIQDSFRKHSLCNA